MTMMMSINCVSRSQQQTRAFYNLNTNMLFIHTHAPLSSRYSKHPMIKTIVMYIVMKHSNVCWFHWINMFYFSLEGIKIDLTISVCNLIDLHTYRVTLNDLIDLFSNDIWVIFLSFQLFNKFSHSPKDDPTIKYSQIFTKFIILFYILPVCAWAVHNF